MTGCWLWVGALLRSGGYGAVRWNGGAARAHRVAYEELVGRIPEELELDHLCRVRCCVNPEHLEPVTHAVNLLRGVGTAIQIKRNKTHCPRGHEYNADNTYNAPHGGRNCRTCLREKEARRRAHRVTTRSS